MVLFHRFGNTPQPPKETWLRLATGWTRFGWYSVAVFIVLSGYCLMLPVATAGAVLALSYLFHLAFERPFQRSAAGKRR